MNGAAVILEHRYFGKSKPFGASDPLTQTDKFQYMTLENVIEDATNFLAHLKRNITGAERSKVIAVSGKDSS